VHFGRDISFYDAISYNKSKYDDNYTSGTTVVPTAGKTVPGTPTWMNKFVASATYANTEFQLTGDFVGKRYATYTNDLDIPSYFLLGLNIGGKLALLSGYLKNPRWNLNVTNLANHQGILQLSGISASASYSTYPIAPRMGFLTLKADI